jgi:urea carboxylase-associated protein 2
MSSPRPEPQADTQATIAANRTRYEALKQAGNGVTPRHLPPPTARDRAPIAEECIRHKETVPGGWYWTKLIRRGEALRIVNTSATPGVSVFAWNAHDTSERYNSADTVKIQWTSDLRKGRVLFSDMGRVLFSIIEDTCCAHDAIVGGSTPASNAKAYGDASLRSTAENMLLAAGKHGLGRRDVAPVISFFAPVSIIDGRPQWREGAVTSGDFVDIRAELDLLVAVSNCPHPLAPRSEYAPDPIECVVYRAPPSTADDICRTASAEAQRGFENNDLYLQA